MKPTFSLCTACLALFLVTGCAATPEYPGGATSKAFATTDVKKKPVQQKTPVGDDICVGQDCGCEAYGMD